MEGINFGKVEKMQVELDLDDKFLNEATGRNRYGLPIQKKTLNIQNFNIKQFSNINYIDNIETIVDHIQQTVSNNVDGIKFKNDDGEFIVTIFHNDEKHGAKKIGQGGSGMVSMTSKINKESFAIKKISNPTRDTIKEIAYNIFKTNKQSSKTDALLNQKSSFIGSILRRDAFYIIMDKIEVSLKNVINTGKINSFFQINLMMVVHEDVLKFFILKIFQQLAILREAGASHGDVKPDNVMFSYELRTRALDSADIQLIDFGCTGPDGASYGATGRYTPLDNWREEINEKIATITYKSMQTSDSKKCAKVLRPRKHGSKFDSWSSFITLLEFLNFSHPFQHAIDSGNYLNTVGQI